MKIYNEYIISEKEKRKFHRNNFYVLAHETCL